MAPVQVTHLCPRQLGLACYLMNEARESPFAGPLHGDRPLTREASILVTCPRQQGQCPLGNWCAGARRTQTPSCSLLLAPDTELPSRARAGHSSPETVERTVRPF